MLTVEMVKKEVESIRAQAVEDRWSGDCHLREDDLFEKVLRAVADFQCADPAGCALAALESKNIEMDRWYE